MNLRTAVLALSLIALQGCNILELAHDPLDCIDRPMKPLSERINLEDLTISDETFDGLEEHIVAYQKRIESQCELINRHNESFNN